MLRVVAFVSVPAAKKAKNSPDNYSSVYFSQEFVVFC